MRRHVSAFAVTIAVAVGAAAQDVITVGSASGSPGTTVQLPVFVRDVSATPLGGDMGAANAIRGFGFKVIYSPASAVSSISFARSGILQSQTALYETTISSAAAIAYVGSFANTTPIVFTMDAAPPGNIIGVIQVSIAPGAVVASSITLSIEPATATLSNQTGTVIESVSLATLALSNGAITIDNASTATALASSVNPSAPGQSVTFTATVTSGAAGTITGAVVLKDGASTLATVSLASGQASYSTAALIAGAHSITAEYSGDATFAASTSAPLTQNVNAVPFGAPTGVAATATSTTQVAVTWFAMSGVDHFDVLRSSNASDFTLAGQPAGPMFTDTVSPGTTYLYFVRAVNGSGMSSADSAVDAATTVIFTDDPAVAGTTVIKAVHVTELRTAVNAFRKSAGLLAAAFEDSSLAGIPVRATHIQQVRDALSAARAITFTDATLAPGTTAIKAAQVQELRDGVK